MEYKSIYHVIKRLERFPEIVTYLLAHCVESSNRNLVEPGVRMLLTNEKRFKIAESSKLIKQPKFLAKKNVIKEFFSYYNRYQDESFRMRYIYKLQKNTQGIFEPDWKEKTTDLIDEILKEDSVFPPLIHNNNVYIMINEKWIAYVHRPDERKIDCNVGIIYFVYIDSKNNYKEDFTQLSSYFDALDNYELRESKTMIWGLKVPENHVIYKSKSFQDLKSIISDILKEDDTN